METHEFEKVRLAVAHMMPRGWSANLVKLQAEHVPHLGGELVRAVFDFIGRKRRVDWSEYEEVPALPAWADKFLKKAFGVREIETQHSVERVLVCPHDAVRGPGEHVRFLSQTVKPSDMIEDRV